MCHELRWSRPADFPLSVTRSRVRRTSTPTFSAIFLTISRMMTFLGQIDPISLNDTRLCMQERAQRDVGTRSSAQCSAHRARWQLSLWSMSPMSSSCWI